MTRRKLEKMDREQLVQFFTAARRNIGKTDRTAATKKYDNERLWDLSKKFKIFWTKILALKVD